MFRKVLVANRGEIAIRIARAARSLGIGVVAVRPPADAESLHVQFADEVAELDAGSPADPVAAYLDADALIAAARRHGCDCVHPGYGFLSESAEFARRCRSADLVFIGPGPDALALFGDKTRARDLAADLGVPVPMGSPGTLADPAAASALAAKIGYPVMLKAAAGGGGRGMRVVNAEDEMAEAFARCSGEARAAFGDGGLFLERRIERPRHIEVQLLADGRGSVVHLYDRDCSVQLRHQKLVEIAPAHGLDASLRARILDDAVKIGRAGRIEGAATAEFLVDPARGGHFFIECNPRIQVEHTVTEVVTGIDLVEAQFRIAAGASLGDLGLADGPAPTRGYAVQARVAARGAGRLAAYREPAGPGVRVDSCGYPGYAPPPQFDPMFAKLICASNSSGDLESALDRARAAISEFLIEGLPTNLGQLFAILSHPDVRRGDARTTLIDETPALAPDAPAPVSKPLALLASAGAVAAGRSEARRPEPGLSPEMAEVGVPSPLTGALVEWRVRPGDRVAEGETVLVLSAMKMETAVAAPTSGTVSRALDLDPGAAVEAGQVLMTLEPGEVDAPAAVHLPSAETWAPMLDEVRTLQALAAARLSPQSEEPGVVRQRTRGKLTCRERIDLLLDPGSFREVGSLAGFASYDDGGAISAFTPANHVGGWGRIDQRRIIVCADDFTSRGGHADGAIGAKSSHLDQLTLDFRCPSVRLLDGSSGGGSVAAMVPQQSREGESRAKESSGAISAGRPRVAGAGGSFLPGHLGSELYAEQLASVPVVNVLLGSVVGIGAAKAVLGHFSVMARDIAQLFVAGPPVVRHAMGYEVTKEDLGDWRIHCRNGSVDNLAETEADAVAQTRRFLSYLPSSVWDAPPVADPDPADPADRRDEALFSIVPRKRTATFDMRRLIGLVADRGSFFEIGPLWGTDQIVGLIRMAGRPMGVIASDSRHANGGALTADGCDKLRRHLDLCDLFHLPVLNLVDNPGFAVGIEHEMAGTIRKGGEWMIAFAQVRTPIFTVIVRRSFGVAGNNYATPRKGPNARVVWPSADVGGIPPEGGIEAAYKRQLAEAADPEALRAEINARIESARGPIGPLNRFQMEEMIDPRDTRRMVCEWMDNAWRVATHPDRLGPRALQFRP